MNMFGASLRCFLNLSLVFMFNVNVKDSSWLLKESRMYVFSKEGMRNGITFY